MQNSTDDNEVTWCNANCIFLVVFFIIKQCLLIYGGFNIHFHCAIYEINKQKWNENTKNSIQWATVSNK